jgi:hypothetical protein
MKCSSGLGYLWLILKDRVRLQELLRLPDEVVANLAHQDDETRRSAIELRVLPDKHDRVHHETEHIRQLLNKREQASAMNIRGNQVAGVVAWVRTMNSSPIARRSRWDSSVLRNLTLSFASVIATDTSSHSRRKLGT